MGKVVVMDHPLIQHKIGIIRKKETGTKDFRQLISEIGNLIVRGEDAIKMAERWLDRGFIGIHLFPWEETFQVNDKVVYPLVELAEDRNVPIVIEAGYPVLSHVTKIAALAQEFPKAKFYMTNAGQLDLGGDSLTDVQYFMHLIPNLHFGTSSAVAALWLSTLIAHPDVGKRIHFETNFPFTDVFMEGFRIDALSLSDEKRMDVFSNNKTMFFPRSR